MMPAVRKSPQESSPGPFGTEASAGVNEPVTCLGKAFPDDNARREHFLGLLREKLQDPEFRKIEGFPLGEDEDILALSDPPYYTTCPNPWIADFIRHYGKPYDPNEPYRREPFAADVSEGKNDPIYNAHSYHTKVPHKAIMRYILHYTEPGDVVFDGFCGSGMTGVAAQMCGDKAVVESLGYRVDEDGTISRRETDEEGKPLWRAFSQVGARRGVLADLSPVATFITHNHTAPVDVHEFEREARHVLGEVEAECGWMYETLHSDGKTKGQINHTVWSDVFICPECTGEIVFFEEAVDRDQGTVRADFPCPHCQARLTKRRMDRARETRFDGALNQSLSQIKQLPVLIDYTVDGRRAEKYPDDADLALIDKIDNGNIPYWFPAVRMPEGIESRRNDPLGITHTHHFYSKRNLWILSSLRSRCTTGPMLLWFNSQLINVSKLNRYRPGVSFPYNPLSGTLYMGSQTSEPCLFTAYKNKLNKLVKSLNSTNSPHIITTQSTTHISEMPSQSVDYIFLDPPFGSNLNYSELSALWERWMKVWTNNALEAIENASQGKDLAAYRRLMAACFKEAHRVLKPGRWMTVEFSNTKASVWNSLQAALTEAGFVVADVSALDKQQGSFKAVTTPTAVKQDLVISAYKPGGGLMESFSLEEGPEGGVWDFVRAHLGYLPVVKKHGDTLQFIPERDPRILFDRMVAHFVRKGHPVTLDSAEFQEGLARRFSYRDGMCFLPDQMADYDRGKMTAGGMAPTPPSVSDESSAIAWLRQILQNRPQTFQDIHPLFIKELGGWQGREKPLELSELLGQNFLCYDGKGAVPSPIYSYLSSTFEELRDRPKDDEDLRAQGKDRWYVPDPNKAGDLEKLRERSLLKEFEEYKASATRKLKVFRMEAVRAGFKKAWQERDYATIIAVARKVPENVLQEDPQLLMWYDQALTRSGGE
ncbi:MAG TPA: DNA methyltransferase [Synergistaceae bacterium]|nr:DNA methyltransferase [Synergistaceae bacterium]HQH78280.1 DNA methyltransferase [Synergistaceae bacterium]